MNKHPLAIHLPSCHSYCGHHLGTNLRLKCPRHFLNSGPWSRSGLGEPWQIAQHTPCKWNTHATDDAAIKNGVWWYHAIADSPSSKCSYAMFVMWLLGFRLLTWSPIGGGVCWAPYMSPLIWPGQWPQNPHSLAKWSRFFTTFTGIIGYPWKEIHTVSLTSRDGALRMFQSRFSVCNPHDRTLSCYEALCNSSAAQPTMTREAHTDTLKLLSICTICCCWLLIQRSCCLVAYYIRSKRWLSSRNQTASCREQSFWQKLALSEAQSISMSWSLATPCPSSAVPDTGLAVTMMRTWYTSSELVIDCVM